MSIAAERILVLHQRKLASTLIANLLEDLEHDGKITREAKEVLYLNYATEFGLTDLLPRKLPTMAQHPLGPTGETMSKGVIIERLAGKAMSAEVMTKLAAIYPGTFGYAAMIDGKLETCSGLDPKDMASYDEILSSDDAIYYLGTDVPAKGAEQPFILQVDEQSKPTLISFIEGEFDEGEYAYVKTFLMPKADDIADLVDGDTTKIMKGLRKQSNVDELSAHYGRRGVVMLMANNGDHFYIETNEQRKTTDWGQISILEGASKTTSVPEVKADDKMSRLRELREKKGKNPDGVHATTAIGEKLNNASDAARTKAPLKEDIDNATVLKDKRETFLYPPPESCVSRNKLQEWYNTGFGTCPQGYQLAEGHPEKAVPMPQSSLNPKRAKDTRFQQTSANVATSSREDKDTGTHHLATDAVVGGFDVVPAKQKEEVGKFIKTIDMKSTDILDPTTMKEIEVKSSTFFDQMGTTFEEFCKWPADKIQEMCQKWPQTARLCIETLRYSNAVTHLQHKKKVDAAETTHVVAKEETKPLSKMEKLKALREAKNAA